MEELIEQVKALAPEKKVELFQALGMHRVGDIHDVDCASRNTSSSCGCVPPESMWTHPRDVEVFLKETWEDRLAQARERDKKRGK